MRCVTSNGKPTLRGLAHFLCSYVRLYSVCCEKSELSKRVFRWPIILNRQYKCAIIQRNSDRMETSAIFFPSDFTYSPFIVFTSTMWQNGRSTASSPSSDPISLSFFVKKSLVIHICVYVHCTSITHNKLKHGTN